MKTTTLTSQTAPEEEPIEQTLRPQTLDEFVGQERMKKNLRVFIDAAKQRKDSIEQFTSGGRADLAAKEQDELAILETLLPPLMSKDDVTKIVKAKAAELGAINPSTGLGTNKTKVNQLIGALMKDLKGKADGAVVKEVVDALFA